MCIDFRVTKMMIVEMVLAISDKIRASLIQGKAL